MLFGHLDILFDAMPARVSCPYSIKLYDILLLIYSIFHILWIKVLC